MELIERITKSRKNQKSVSVSFLIPIEKRKELDLMGSEILFMEITGIFSEKDQKTPEPCDPPIPLPAKMTKAGRVTIKPHIVEKYKLNKNKSLFINSLRVTKRPSR